MGARLQAPLPAGGGPGPAVVRDRGASQRSAPPSIKRSPGDDVAGAWPGVADSEMEEKEQLRRQIRLLQGGSRRARRASPSSPLLHSGPLPASPEGPLRPRVRGRVGSVGRWVGSGPVWDPEGAFPAGPAQPRSGFRGGCGRYRRCGLWRQGCRLVTGGKRPSAAAGVRGLGRPGALPCSRPVVCISSLDARFEAPLSLLTATFSLIFLAQNSRPSGFQTFPFLDLRRRVVQSLSRV